MRAADDRERLLAAIYAAPEDDTARLVYADALLDAGDPRGELIMLQCRGIATAEQRAREAELLSAFRGTWLGELAPIVTDARFERGFLTACRVDLGDMFSVRALAGHPAWSTVLELRGSAEIGLHPRMRALKKLGFSARDAADTEHLPTAWRDLLVDTPRPLVSLRYKLPTSSDEQVAALASCAALPALEELAIEGSPEAWLERVLAGPIVHRLAALEYCYWAAVDRTVTVRLLDGGSRARIDVASPDGDRAIVAALPASVVDLTLVVDAEIVGSRPTAERLAVAAAARGIATRLASG